MRFYLWSCILGLVLVLALTLGIGVTAPFAGVVTPDYAISEVMNIDAPTEATETGVLFVRLEAAYVTLVSYSDLTPVIIDESTSAGCYSLTDAPYIEVKYIVRT